MITIFVDDESSWYLPYAMQLVEALKGYGYKDAMLATRQADVLDSDICFLLSCSKIVRKDFLYQHKHNIVIHASDLPAGKGFAPIKWQVLEGKNDIILTLFEAVEAVDAGPYYMKRTLHLNGYELMDEIHEKLARLIQEMCLEYAAAPESFPPIQQEGEESFYQRFSDEDDRLNIDATLREQFNHFRIEDNDRYPLWFQMNGNIYILKIFRKE